MTLVVLTPLGDYAANCVADWGLGALGTEKYIHHERAAINVEAIRAAATAGATVFYFGHGQVDKWIECAANGYDAPHLVRDILDVPNAKALGQAVVLAFACFSGAQLGPAAVQSGVQRFVGFRDTLFWYPQVKRSELTLARVVQDLVRLTLQRGAAATLDELVKPIRDRQRYFEELSSRGDAAAASIAGVLAILADTLTLN